jgi:hypothetical protein
MRPTNQNRQFPTTPNLGNKSQCFFLEMTDSPRLGFQIHTAKEVVWDILAFGEGDLVGYYGETAVHLHCVAVDDFAVEAGG